MDHGQFQMGSRVIDRDTTGLGKGDQDKGRQGKGE